MIALVAALAIATPASDAEIERYYSMLSTIRSDEVVLPITKCARTKIRAYSPPASELGDLKKAADLLNSSLVACGFEAGQDKIKASVQSAYPDTQSADVERVSQYAFAIPVALLLGEATDQLKVPPPPGPERKQIDIPLPCPPHLKAKPGHACFEKPSK